MWYYIVIALQGFCIYHAIKYRRPYYWIFIIFFLSLIGCIIYFFTQVYSKSSATKITSELTNIINPAKKIQDLEKQLEFTDTYQNRVNLADAYLQNKDYQKAIHHYKNALDGNIQNDFYVIKNMIDVFDKQQDYKNVIAYSNNIKSHPEFSTSRTQFLYGIALKNEGNLDEAEANLKAIDIRFSFYEERLIFANFLKEIGKNNEAKEILKTLISEGKRMTDTNKKQYRNTILSAEKLLTEL